MSQKRIWKEYISAQSKILEHKSKPIGIDNSNPIQFNGLKVSLSIDQEIFKQVFKKEVEQIFNIQDFSYNNGYIQTSVENTANITNEQLTNLKELSEKCYIDFNENPVIEGTITKRGNNIKDELQKVVGDLPTNYHFKNSGLVFLTLNEWKKINEIEGIKLERQVGAVFPIKPSVSYIISTFYKNLDISQQGNKITIVGELHKNIFDLFQKHFGLSYRSNDLNFKFKNKADLSREVDKLEDKGVVLPKPEDGIMTFHFGIRFYEKHESDLDFEAFRLKRALKRYFPDNPFKLSFTTNYSFDFALMDNGADELDRNEETFWNELYAKVHGEDFQVSQSRRTISFDFETEEELIQNTNFVKSFSIYDTNDYGNNHKYKFKIKFETGLHELGAKLKKEYPNLNTKLIANGEKLIFRQFYRTGNKTEILARLHNQLDEFIDSEIFDYSIPPSHTFQEKYLCEENFELKIEQEEEKLSKLLRTDFYFGTPKEKLYLGKLLKVDYPDLYFVIDEERIDKVKEDVSEETIKAIFPDLKGEKDKIKRLEDTLLKLDSEQELPNNNAKDFLYDSSKAKGIEDIEYLLNKTSPEWQEFEDNLFFRISK